MGDMNARMIKAEDDDERIVFGSATVQGRKGTVGELSSGTEANRGHLIRFCLRNGLHLSNTFFQKTVDKLAMYKPKDTKDLAPVSENTHEQIDYIISKKEH